MLFSFLFIFFTFIFLFFRLIELGKWKSGSIKFTETNVVLSDNTGIKRVKIQQNDKIIVHTFFWFNNHTTSVFFFISLLIILFIFEVFKFVRNNKVLSNTFMHD